MSRLAKAVVAAWMLSLVYRGGQSDGAREQQARDFEFMDSAAFVAPTDAIRKATAEHLAAEARGEAPFPASAAPLLGGVFDEATVESLTQPPNAPDAPPEGLA